MLPNTGELHAKAMELAEMADVARFRRDNERYLALIRQALTLETQAANTLRDVDEEPSRSVLYRSAASLAVECQLYREAERLVAIGLSGNPPDEIAQELRAILEDIHFQFNLIRKRIKLERREIRFAVSGKETGYGIAPSDLVLERLNNLKTIIHRTIERLKNLAYREGGAGTEASNYPVYLLAPSPSSFEVGLSIGSPQIPLPGMTDPVEEIIKEILTCTELVENGDYQSLQDRIPDHAYYTNFLTQIKRLAPDGELISSVQISALQDGEERKLILNKRRQEITVSSSAPSTDDVNSEPELFQIKGKLRFADGLSDQERGTIKLVTLDQGAMKFDVPRGMDDIVAQHWSKNVVVSYSRVGKKLLLQDIDVDHA